MTRPQPTPRDRGIMLALELQRTVDPRDWRKRVDAIEDPEERRAAEDYLRAILTRMKVVRSLKRPGDR